MEKVWLFYEVLSWCEKHITTHPLKGLDLGDSMKGTFLHIFAFFPVKIQPLQFSRKIDS